MASRRSADDDQRRGEHEHDDERRAAPVSRTSSGWCSCRVPEAVGERVHVAVLHDRLLDDQGEHRRRRLELRDVGGVRGDPGRDLEQAETDRSMLVTATIRTASRPATTSAATSPIASAIVQ